MQAFFPSLQKAYRDQEGAAAVEYAVLIVLVAIVIIASVAMLGQKTRDAYEQVNPAFSGTGTSQEGTGTSQEGKCGDKDSADDANCGKGND